MQPKPAAIALGSKSPMKTNASPMKKTGAHGDKPVHSRRFIPIRAPA